jgi:hypothetical protein
VAGKTSQVVTDVSALLDFTNAGKFLGLTRWQMRGLVRSRELPVVSVGNKFYFRRATLVRWAEKSEALVAS